MDVAIRIVADGLVVVIFVLALYGFIGKVPRQQWFDKGWRVVLAGITAYLVAKLIAALYQPEVLRPFEKLGVDAGAAYLPNPGFPSDHMLFATFLTLAVWLTTRSKPLAGTMLALTIVMGIGRVLALVHTPLDIIGGFVIAFSGIGWFYWPKVKK